MRSLDLAAAANLYKGPDNNRLRVNVRKADNRRFVGSGRKASIIFYIISSLRIRKASGTQDSVLLTASAGNDIFSDASWRAWTEPYYTTDGTIAGTHSQ